MRLNHATVTVAGAQIRSGGVPHPSWSSRASQPLHDVQAKGCAALLPRSDHQVRASGRCSTASSRPAQRTRPVSRQGGNGKPTKLVTGSGTNGLTYWFRGALGCERGRSSEASRFWATRA